MGFASASQREDLGAGCGQVSLGMQATKKGVISFSIKTTNQKYQKHIKTPKVQVDIYHLTSNIGIYQSNKK